MRQELRYKHKFKKVQKDSKIKFDEFIKILKDTLGLETELHKNNVNNHKAIALFLDIPNRITQPDVDLDKVSRFLNWFEGYKSNEIIVAIQQIVKTKWFFGALDKEEANKILSRKENHHTGTFLVRWDNNEFVLSFIFTEKKDEKNKEGSAKQIAHVSTKSKNLKDLFENESVWKQSQNLSLKSSFSPERPGGYQDLEGVWFKTSYITSGTSYTAQMEGINPAAPTQLEQMNQQKGLPSFDMVL